MNILVVNDTFSVGGAEIFSARLAQAFFKAGHNVWLYSIHNGSHIDYEVLKHNAPDVPLITLNTKFDWFVEKVTSVFRRAKVDHNVREFLVVKHLRTFIRDNKIDVAHAHMFMSDYILSIVKQEVDFARVASMHGTHEGFLYNYINSYGWMIPDYINKLNKCLSTLNGIVYGTERNLTFLKEKVIDQKATASIIKEQIYNGFEMQTVKGEVSRSSLGIKEDDKVFAFMARGIEAKGWPLVLESFLKIDSSKAHLILIGDSDYVKNLRQQYAQYTNIHFVGYQTRANEWIAISNIGLLPSTFGESIPTVIVEFLAQNKPMIVTDVAECANMIAVGDQFAGFVIGVPKDEAGFVDDQYQIDRNILANMMQKYIDNDYLLKNHEALASKAFEKFNMRVCMEKHIHLFNKAIVQNKMTE